VAGVAVEDPGGADRERDTYRSAGGDINPRMVSDGEHQRQRWGSAEIAGRDSPVVELRDAVRRDEPESLRAAVPYEMRRMIPPVHDEIGSFGDVVMRATKCFNVPVSERSAHSLITDEGGIPDDELCLGPFGTAGVDVAHDGYAFRVVRHLLARHWVELR
jgi:hypothetical protein